MNPQTPPDVLEPSESATRTNSDAVIVFAKAPIPGAVKTRLAPVLSHARGAVLYGAFVRDTLQLCRSVAADTRLYVTGSSGTFPDGALDAASVVCPQRGEGLGRRMAKAFAETFDEGYDRVLIIGSDHPTLSPAILRNGLNSLGSRDGRSVCVGPSGDGGYYLLGMTRPCDEIFEMEYSHPDVLAQTLRAIRRAGRLPVILPEWYDVDRPGDLERLIRELSDHPERAPHTRAALDRLGLTREDFQGEFSTD